MFIVSLRIFKERFGCNGEGINLHKIATQAGVDGARGSLEQGQNHGERANRCLGERVPKVRLVLW